MESIIPLIWFGTVLGLQFCYYLDGVRVWSLARWVIRSLGQRKERFWYFLLEAYCCSLGSLHFKSCVFILLPVTYMANKRNLLQYSFTQTTYCSPLRAC
ncbi:hypothetical protein LZ32DRAFT_39171 [Colletotrichum eremochloae]|nr:hypothetical protein LZ32DRAFT_39171 [Colletotrichum eremochloae]